ncbi:ACH96134.1 Ac81-like protein [Kallithea virus]|uniref:ACH96134.1 Ac81-like protein n=1 Tax=Kallithea virus TaxID=1654582 RepID=A0A1S5VFY5_9VIRU|nr:ACH96134.1 Ac81-like protein [Kallithea virus]AQN78564.1 ACH96134.1 Ac81-like protein [Kallithea virus]
MTVDWKFNGKQSKIVENAHSINEDYSCPQNKQVGVNVIPAVVIPRKSEISFKINNTTQSKFSIIQSQQDQQQSNISPSNLEDKISYTTIEVRCQAMRKSFGLFDHYFLVIKGKEYHAGWYARGMVLDEGTTKGAHTVSVQNICKMCYDKIFAEFYVREDLRIFNAYFPFINCETICMGFSIQSLAFLIIPFVCTFIAKGLFLYAILLILVTIVLFLIYSKYQFSRTVRTKCSHLE